MWHCTSGAAVRFSPRARLTLTAAREAATRFAEVLASATREYVARCGGMGVHARAHALTCSLAVLLVLGIDSQH